MSSSVPEDNITMVTECETIISESAVSSTSNSHERDFQNGDIVVSTAKGGSNQGKIGTFLRKVGTVYCLVKFDYVKKPQKCMLSCLRLLTPLYRAVALLQDVLETVDKDNESAEFSMRSTIVDVMCSVQSYIDSYDP